MDFQYWQKQSLEQPLFEDLIWSKPQQKSLAGKLLIVGGNIHSIAAPGEAYEITQKQNIGECKVVMPDVTRKLLGPKPPPNIELVNSTPSGSFSSQASDDIKSFMVWGNATLFAGDFSHSSETAILLEKLSVISGLQIYTLDGADYFSVTPLTLLKRPDTLLVLSIAELQKYSLNANFSKSFTSNMELLQLVEALHELTKIYPCHIVVEHKMNILAASNGQVISTKLIAEPKSWQLKVAATAAVWCMQNPSKPLQAISTAITQIEL
jgi:hypothetical protein